jgi:hypothetical protein
MKTTKKIPLFDKYPRHVAAHEKLRQLWAKREELVKKKDAILARPKPLDSIDLQAEKLLNSDTLELPAGVSRDDEELKLAYRDIRIVDAAIKGQQQAIERLEFEISTRISEETKPKYTEKIRAIVAAAQTLAECVQQEQDLRVSLRDEGVTLTFETLPFDHIGYPDDEYSWVNIYCRQAKEAGYL